MLFARDEDFRDRLLPLLALVRGLAFLTLVRVLVALLTLGLAFLVLVRVLVTLVAERPRAGFSGFVSGAAAGIAAGLRPRPKPLAS